MRLTFGLFALVAMLGSYSTMVAAQPQREAATQNVDVREDRDSGFNAGWLGILGLAGLMGMKRSESRDRTLAHSNASATSPVR